MPPKALVTSIHKSAQGPPTQTTRLTPVCFLYLYFSITYQSWRMGLCTHVHMLVILRGCACTGYAHLHLPVHMNLLAYTYTHAYAHVRMRACVRKYESCNETDG